MPILVTFNSANIANLAITLLVLIGLAVRHNRKLHPWIMTACFAADLGLVLYLELARGAVEKAAANLSPLMITHIALSTAMLVLYVTLSVSGWRLLKGRGASRKSHKTMAAAFVAVRLAVVVTAFMVAGDA